MSKIHHRRRPEFPFAACSGGRKYANKPCAHDTGNDGPCYRRPENSKCSASARCPGISANKVELLAGAWGWREN